MKEKVRCIHLHYGARGKQGQTVTLTSQCSPWSAPEAVELGAANAAQSASLALREQL